MGTPEWCSTTLTHFRENPVIVVIIATLHDYVCTWHDLLYMSLGTDNLGKVNLAVAQKQTDKVSF